MRDEYTIYKFETHPGLPPDGEGGQYFGFSADGRAFILCWQRSGHWSAIGYDHRPDGSWPLAVLCRDDMANFIVKWSHAPLTGTPS
jgi:hypothetical protein